MPESFAATNNFATFVGESSINGLKNPNIPMNLPHRIYSLVGLLFIGAATAIVQAQDIIARQAPVDRRVKAADSVSLKHLITVEAAEEIAGLYPDFNNTSVHNYKGVAVPDSFRIDLRHFCMPTPSRQITSNYGYRRAFRRMHQGLDVKVYIGDTIKSAFDGKVRIVDYEGGGYGKYVVVRHNNGLETVYGHLSKQLVAENQTVKAGEPIGLGGNTGKSTGSHLHFECLFLGKAIDPQLLFDFPNQDIVSDFYTYRSNASQSSNSHYASANTETTTANQQPAAENQTGGVKYHKVKRGDSLYSIASKLGTSVDKLCELNHINKRQSLRPGQILRYAE